MLQVTFESNEELENEQSKHVESLQKQQLEAVKDEEARVKIEQTERKQKIAAKEERIN